MPHRDVKRRPASAGAAAITADEPPAAPSLPTSAHPVAVKPLRPKRGQTKCGGGAVVARRFLVPRARWDDLPDWMWYVMASQPGQRYSGRGRRPKPLWEYTRGRPWRGAVKLPCLAEDPLFLEPDRPALLRFRPSGHGKKKARGIVLICPGGNYEFLSPQEGAPVADWISRAGLQAYVLRYRLLPAYGVDDALEDLSDAVRRLRKDHGDVPICVMGFSAGAHLCATFCSATFGRRFREAAGLKGDRAHLVQVLCYPCLDASEWSDPDKAGWWGWNYEACDERRRGQELAAYNLVRARPVSDVLPMAPTFIMHSVDDHVVTPEAHSDRYARRVSRAAATGIAVPPLFYLRGAFGDHGCGVTPCWSGLCLAWLRDQGFDFGQ